MDLEKEAPNVVTETGLRDLFNEGFQLEVVCTVEAHRRSSTWYGVWIIRAVNDEGYEKHLVTARTRKTGSDIKVREFKTATGLISFLRDLGCKAANIPLYEGHRATYRLPREDDEGGAP